ncbi:MAG: ribonuclease H family protein [Ponticaulis sp.]|nr:ribonuclease H family protein [Ponticaulis sp.]|tara:strand:- start:32625 stop:33032 length:408 start_codon:yes stop_codon:yes gene_type:complete
MVGETNLDALIRSMQPVLKPNTFVFADYSETPCPPELEPVMVFQEAEGQTLIITREMAERYSLPYSFPCRQITLNIHSSLEAVGFLAAITTQLARHGIPVNAVSAFFHDHLFVPEDRADEALSALKAMAADAEQF